MLAVELFKLSLSNVPTVMKTAETKNNQKHGKGQAWWHTTGTLARGRWGKGPKSQPRLCNDAP